MFLELCVAMALMVGVTANDANRDEVQACMEERIKECFPGMAMINEMPSEGIYEGICTTTRVVLDCWQTDLICGGERWDGDCYISRFIEFLEDVNLCKNFTGSAPEKVTRLAKRCLDRMVEVLETTDAAKPCVYFGEFAECILTHRRSLVDEILDDFRDSTKMVLRLNMPHVFGAVDDAPFCPEWNEQYAQLLSDLE